MPSMRSLWRRLLPTGPSRGYNRRVWRPMRDNSVVPEPQGQGKVANGWKAGRTELGGLHHHGRRMIFTGVNVPVLCWRRVRSAALGSRHRQPRGLEQKLRAQFSEFPTIRIPGQLPYRPLAVWTVAACLLERCGRAGAGLWPVP